MTLIRSDIKGLFIKAGGYIFRPGEIAGLSHAVDTSDGNLKVGDKIKARHVAGTTYCRITLNNGSKIYWSTEYAHKQQQQALVWREYS